MKINLFSFITIFIFVHSATYAHMISTEVRAGPDAVLDLEGDVLRYNLYYIRPVTEYGGISGIVPYPMPKETCTYGVSGVRYALGSPVALLQHRQLGGAILENTDLNITFTISIGCNSTDVWRKGEPDEATGQSFVVIGVSGNPPESYETRGNAFQIRKAGDDYYKFVYCPPTCDSCYEKCEDVGIFTQESQDEALSHLAVSADTPFHVRFQKYEPISRCTEVGCVA